jgi:hypothetical protein
MPPNDKRLLPILAADVRQCTETETHPKCLLVRRAG